MTPSHRFSGRAHAARNAAAAVCALLFYYGVPLDFDVSNWPTKIIGLLAFVGGVVGLSWQTWRRVGSYMAAPDATSRRVDGVLFTLCIAVVFFALFYYVLELRDPGQFDGLRTRTDSLYYTIITLGTVGYGDVHAVGQAARIATMVQVAFDLVVIGVLLAVATTSITHRMEATASRDKPPFD